MERNFGNNLIVAEADKFDYNIMTQLFCANLKEGDTFELGSEKFKRVVTVAKVTADKSMRWDINGKKKTMWWYPNNRIFIGHKGRGVDWLNGYLRDIEGLIIIDLLNVENPFHKESIFSTIAKRDKIYAA